MTPTLDDMIAVKNAAQERDHSELAALCARLAARDADLIDAWTDRDRLRAKVGELRAEVERLGLELIGKTQDVERLRAERQALMSSATVGAGRDERVIARLRAQVETLTRERDEARARVATQIATATGTIAYASLKADLAIALGEHATGDTVADVRRVVERLDGREHGAVHVDNVGGARRRILDDVRAALHCPDDTDVVPWARRFGERLDRLRSYLARALRGCDTRERVAIEADMRLEASDGE